MLSALRISRWYTLVPEAMMWRRDPEISVVTAPVRNTMRKNCWPSGLQIVSLNRTRANTRAGRTTARRIDPAFFAPSPSHVIAMEMIAVEKPATAIGYTQWRYSTKRFQLIITTMNAATMKNRTIPRVLITKCLER